MEEGERDGDGFLSVLRALRDAARSVEGGEDGGDGPALRALLALDAAADDLLAGDPELHPLCRLLATVRALSLRVRSTAGDEGGGMVGGLRARCRRCKARRGIARAAGGVAAEIQAWADRELAARLVAALRGDDPRARALLAELEARLVGAGAGAGRFDARLQDAVLRHGVFGAVEARLGEPGEVGDGCAAAALALVRFNRDVFVGPVLMCRAVGALVSAAAASPASSPAALRALNGLVAAIRTPLVDELHARGELPRLVALLCAPAEPRARAPALELCLRVAYYGRRDVLDALLAEGLVKRLLCLQRTAADTDTDTDTTDATGEEEKAMASIAVARLAVQVEAGQGLRPREKRAAKLEILRRVREAAVSPAEEAAVLTSVLWGATP